MPIGGYFIGVMGTPPPAVGAVDISAVISSVAGPPVADVASDVASAIFSYWISRTDLTSLVAGGLWTGQAPASVSAMPYAVLTQVSDVEQERTTGFKMHRALYQLSIMATGLAEAESLCRSVSDAFDEATLALDGFLACFAADIRWTLGVGLGLGGDDCWMCYVELEIMYTR